MNHELRTSQQLYTSQQLHITKSPALRKSPSSYQSQLHTNHQLPFVRDAKSILGISDFSTPGVSETLATDSAAAPSADVQRERVMHAVRKTRHCSQNRNTRESDHNHHRHDERARHATAIKDNTCDVQRSIKEDRSTSMPARKGPQQSTRHSHDTTKPEANGPRTTL